MFEWICPSGYNFKLYPEIGTWGCYDIKGNFINPVNITNNILMIFVCMIFIYFIYASNCKKKPKKLIL